MSSIKLFSTAASSENELQNLLRMHCKYQCKQLFIIKKDIAKVFEKVLSSDSLTLLESVQELGCNAKTREYFEKISPFCEVDIIGTSGKVEQVIRDYFIPLFAPVQKASSGLKGPTLLVKYGEGSSQAKSYVIKWTNRNEVETSLRYKKLFSGYFSFPEMKEIDPAISVLPALLKELSLEAREDTDRVVVMENISGTNLVDFICNEYDQLSDRARIFKRLGRLIVFDLFMGNLDRIVRPGIQEDGTYCLEALPSNLDNVMIRHNKQNSVLYAIDNETDPSLSEKEGRLNYFRFLEDLFTREDCVDLLVKDALDSILYGLSECLESRSTGFNQNNLTQFKKELKEDAPPLFKEGIVDAFEVLGHRLFPLHSREENAGVNLIVLFIQKEIKFMSASPIPQSFCNSWIASVNSLVRNLTDENLLALSELADSTDAVVRVANKIKEAVKAHSFGDLRALIEIEMRQRELPILEETPLPCPETPFASIPLSLCAESPLSTLMWNFPPDFSSEAPSDSDVLIPMSSRPVSRNPSPSSSRNFS